MTLITSIGQQLSSFWQIGQNALTQPDQAGSKEAETSPPIIIDLSGDATSGSSSQGTPENTDPPERAVAPTGQSGSQITANPGAGDRQAPTIESQRSARVEAQLDAEADVGLDAARAAAEAARDSLLREAMIASVRKGDPVEPFVKPVEADGPERAGGAYGTSADDRSTARATPNVTMDV